MAKSAAERKRLSRQHQAAQRNEAEQAEFLASERARIALYRKKRQGKEQEKRNALTLSRQREQQTQTAEARNLHLICEACAQRVASYRASATTSSVGQMTKPTKKQWPKQLMPQTKEDRLEEDRQWVAALRETQKSNSAGRAQAKIQRKEWQSTWKESICRQKSLKQNSPNQMRQLREERNVKSGNLSVVVHNLWAAQNLKKNAIREPEHLSP